MGNINFYRRPDIRLFILLERIAQAYISNRFRVEKKQQEAKWEKMFKDTAILPFQLDKRVKINLYKDSDLSKLIHFSSFEQEELSFLKRFLKKGDIFFDIGANVGLFSLLASDAVGEQGNIYSFEPTPATYERLIGNIQLNNFKNIVPNRTALSNEPGVLPFNILEDGGDVYNSFVKVDKLKDARTISVQTTTVDRFIETTKIDVSRIKFAKIDVEGWEMNVLKGAVQLLSGSEPPVLMIEFSDLHAQAAGSSCKEIFDFVKSFGYEWYRYHGGRNELSVEKYKSNYVYDNLIAAKNISQVMRDINN